ncbi:hypothetical protein V6V47_08365 [Micromonospora sp. CPCC 205539]|uniref:hypothetical protein n=1 Tax=Micromonospora sp. CPCC 205539 TaxID=3122408 RepID=UPI002FEE7925
MLRLRKAMIHPVVGGAWRHRITAVVATATAGVLLTAGAAQAASPIWLSDGSGVANWTEDGDRLTVCDQAADGWGVRGYIYRPNAGDPANGTVLIKVSDPSSNSDCASASADISESIAINIKVCNYAGDVVTYCRYTSAR